MKVVLSYGMGVDSTAILLRWLTDPSSRDFDLSDLIVLTAQVGDEFESTTRLVDSIILPMLRKANVRTVEIGRVSGSARDGIKVLQDTRWPRQMHPGEVFRLSDEFRASGVIAASGGVHKCSIKSKAEPLTRWLDAEFSGETYTHAMGFNADEQGRADRDVTARAKSGALSSAYRIAFGYNADETKRAAKGQDARAKKAQSAPEFPLIEWGWTYADCEDFIFATVFVDWPKSACTHCPFSGGKKSVLRRYRAEPQAAADAMALEQVALALNPRMNLFVTKSLHSVIEADENHAALALFEAQTAAAEWATYRVRRIYSGPGKAVRDVQVTFRGTKAEATARATGVFVERDTDAAVTETLVFNRDGSADLNKHGKQKIRKQYVTPVIEELWTAAPAHVAAKCGSKTFEEKWATARRSI
jgi:hypothetical protein